MRRKAGDLINEYLREGRLATNRAEPIGAGANAVVYASDVPGNVMKQSSRADSHQYANDFEKEVNLQAIAAEMGIAPRVAGLEQFAGGIGNRIEMADVRQNFEAMPQDPMLGPQMISDYAMAGTRKDLQHVCCTSSATNGTVSTKRCPSRRQARWKCYA